MVTTCVFNLKQQDGLKWTHQGEGRASGSITKMATYPFSLFFPPKQNQSFPFLSMTLGTLPLEDKAKHYFALFSLPPKKQVSKPLYTKLNTLSLFLLPPKSNLVAFSPWLLLAKTWSAWLL